MRRAPVLSLALWSAVAGCGKTDHLVDGGMPGTDLPTQASAIAFGDADCGTTPSPQTLSFHNTGTSNLTWNAIIQGDGFAITDGAQGGVAPGGTGSITITPAPVPGTIAVGAQIEATLFVMTNASDSAVVVPLSITAHGGSLHVGTPTIGFGQVQLTETVEQDLQITNAGDRSIQIALGAPADADFSATWDGGPTAASVDPSASLAGAAAHFDPSTAGDASDAIAVNVTGPLCAGDAPSIALTGQGTTAQVSVTPGTLQFGTTDCGATATAQTVTIQNDYGFAITYTATIESGPYTIAAGEATGSVPANGKTTISVKANAVPRAAASLANGALAGTMTVSTNAPASTPANLSMAQTADGAVLATTPAGGQTIAFGPVAYGTPGNQSFSIANTGNTPAAITASASGPGYSTTTPGNGTIPATGANVAGTVTETVGQRGALDGTLTIATTTPLCQPAAPAAIDLTATGQASVASIGAVPAMTSTCGAATTPVNISVTNNGDQPLVITAASATGNFAVTSSVPMTIAVGASQNVTVQPPAAVVGTDAAGSVKTGTLSLTTNEIGNPTHQVGLSTTVTGAVLALTPTPGSTINFGNVDLGTPGNQSYSVKNTGNLAATVTASVSGAGYTLTQPNGGAIPTGGTAENATVTQTVTAHGTTNGTLSIASSTAQCAATPGSVSLTAFDRTPTAVIGTVPGMSATCGGGTPAAVGVSVQNTGDGPLVITGASATGSFVVTSTFPITVAAGSSTTISVRPPSAVIGTDVGGGTKAGTLTITTNELGTNTHQVGLSSTVIGANLSLANAAGQTITSISFSTSGNCPAPTTIFVNNTGNAPATVSITTANQQGFQWFAFSPSSTIAAGGQASQSFGVWTLNNDQCTESETVEYTATGSVCTALPFGLQATASIGQGTSCFCS